ncbi:hypothetical protein [Streptomyces sp. NPDC014733]
MPAALLEDFDLDIRELLDEEADETAAKGETSTVILTVQPSTCNC